MMLLINILFWTIIIGGIFSAALAIWVLVGLVRELNKRK